jgi:hypothetical protein
MSCLVVFVCLFCVQSSLRESVGSISVNHPRLLLYSLYVVT